MHYTLRRSLLLLAAAFASQAASAQDVAYTPAQYHHSAWTAQDGAPTGIFALAQTPDGYLWIGSETGLFRFDGVTFERFESSLGVRLRSSNIAALRAEPDGSLWIGYRFGGASVLRGGSLTTYGEAEGLPPGSAWGFARDSSGTEWIAATGGLARLIGGRWQAVGVESGIEGTFASALLVDRHGAVWAVVGGKIYRRAPRAQRFEHVGDPLDDVGFGYFADGPDGTVWFSPRTGGLQRLSTGAGAASFQSAGVGPVPSGSFLFDREGTLWVTTNEGIHHIGSDSWRSPRTGRGPLPPRIGPDQGLSGSQAFAFLEDREGNIWVATSGGLDQFRRNRLTEPPLLQPTGGLALAPADTGAVWAASWATGVALVRDSAVKISDTLYHFESISRDPDGSAWLASPGSLWHLSGRKFSRRALPQELGTSQSSAIIQAIARDRSGALWISVIRAGAFKLSDGVWTKSGNLAALPQLSPLALLADPDGTMWFGYADNRIASVQNGRVRVFTERDGLDVGAVLVLCRRSERLWIGGERGLAVLEQGRIRPVRAAGSGGFRGISGIVVRANGELWLNGASGIIRVDASEVRKATSDPSYSVRYELFDHRDGLRGVAEQIRPLPTAVEATDGRLWFATAVSAAWIDPSRIFRNPLPPPVLVRSLTAGDSSYDTRSSITLPKGTGDVRIDYTALSLAVPDRVRFRYRLEGNDTAWQSVDSRRVAFYTNLRPGHYRFRVIASNNDGVWNKTGAELAFAIPPTFVQSRMFLALCVATLAALIWLLNTLRLRQVSRAMRGRFDAALAERTRIAQELHDTLIQGFTGITLQLQSVQLSMTDRPDVVEKLARVLGLADQALREARHSVWDMRAPAPDEADLADVLASQARATLMGSEIEVTLAVSGERRRLPRGVEETALRIGRESVTNAVKHARARTIAIQLDYGDTGLTLRVQDDGRGFVPAEGDAAPGGGHWGLVGMRERALRAGGTFEIRAASEGGTTISIFLPLDDHSKAG